VLGVVSKWLFRPLGGVTDTVESFEDEVGVDLRMFEFLDLECTDVRLEGWLCGNLPIFEFKHFALTLL
jgi:hypothetical protein